LNIIKTCVLLNPSRKWKKMTLWMSWGSRRWSCYHWSLYCHWWIQYDWWKQDCMLFIPSNDLTISFLILFLSNERSADSQGS